MEYNIKISFELNTFKNSSEAYNMVKDIFSFKITHFYTTSKNVAQDYNEIELINFLKNNNDNFFMLGGEIKEDDFEKIIFKREHPIFNLECVSINVRRLEDVNFDLLINRIQDNNFCTAFITNNEKSRWQNQIFVNQFDIFNRPYTFVKRKPNFMSSNQSAGDMIDIFYNPGHERIVYGMQIMAAPEMWFGKKALELFNKNDLLSFRNAIEIKELENGVIYVKLFDFNELDWEIPKILNIQKEFRTWSRMDEIESILREKIPNHNKMLN